MTETIEATSTTRRVISKTRMIVWISAVAFVVLALIRTALDSGPVIGSRDMTIDPKFGIPQPPEGLTYNVTANVVTLVVMAAIGLLGVAWAVSYSLRTRSLLPLTMSISGVMIVFPEVYFDVIGAVYFPWSDTQPAGHAFGILGREMPWWIVVSWFGYGSFAFIVYRVLLGNPKTKVIWLLWLVAAINATVLEEVLLTTGIYHYYGNQPLILISELPWWWTPCNSLGVLLAAFLAFRYREALTGWKSLAMMVIMPCSITAVYGAIALPSWIVVNGDYPWLVTQLAGLVTIALGFVVFAVMLNVVLRRPAFDMDSVAPETLRSPVA